MRTPSLLPFVIALGLTPLLTGSTMPLSAQTVIAHRGASAFLPEHTFVAWDRALEMGADYIELDLQMTSDGVLVVLHDETLDRTTWGPAGECTGRVIEMTAARLRRCEVSRWKVEALRSEGRLAEAEALAALPPQRIPTLEEVFARYGSDGRVRYYIETKTPDAAPGMEEELVRLLRAYGLDPASRHDRTVIVQSFSAESLRALAGLAPELPLVQLGEAGIEGGRDASEVMREIAEWAIGWGPPHRVVTPERVEAAHAAGLVVHPYTVNDPARMRELLTSGVDGLFTDRPEVLLELLGR
ncbi:MAG: glycerophosphodiester phosphodiesterase family protein [Longimicrobiales bacterium]|nr:glycerophosphodiester phosphodiesterase family protein [Longimicrobiales bacterium]